MLEGAAAPKPLRKDMGKHLATLGENSFESWRVFILQDESIKKLVSTSVLSTEY